ncbi:MAG: homocysteine S-methyltransferase family protein [Lachnospiraceae bacterium]
MTKQQFRQLVADSIVLLDGAMGSNLIKRGMPQGVCPEKWILENQETVIALQKEYVENGTKILYAPTFTANRPKLKEYGLENQLKEINKGLVDISKKAAGAKALIAGDLTMTGIQLKPVGPMDFEELIAIYKEQVQALLDAGVDLFVVETMMSLQETRAAVIAIKELCELPIMASMTFEKDGRTLFGTDAKTAAIVLSKLGVDAAGANCSTGPKQMACVISEMESVTDIPIIAKPNAGIPYINENKETAYDNTPENFAKEMRLLIDAGASLIGGCCGTTPEYIAACKACDFKRKEIARDRNKLHYLTSERQTLAFGLNDSFLIIGERINPTGKKALQEELRNGKLERVIQFAEEQEENGASVLDVNLGMSGIDEKEMMLKVIDELQTVTNLPLCIDSSHVDVIEAALRRYPGRALINSISYEKAKFEKLIPIAKKYGAMFILLPLSDKGLPKDLDEKKEIIRLISRKAFEEGFTKEDIIVDGLVTTVGANNNAGVETLETIRYCKENGYATTCGLSNISFGLPERGYINAAFLAMAIAQGLTTAIANPNQTLLMNTALSCNLLKNCKDADIAYIERMNALKESGICLENKPTVREKTNSQEMIKEQEPNDSKSSLKEAVLKGKKSTIAQLTQKCLDENEEPSFLLNEILIPAINEVGNLFEKGKYFLPQLIASAEAMKNSIEVLEPLLQQESNGRQMPVVVIATVAGDIHDIGKNLVALMLKNYGFKVIDLGKDVKREVIIETAIKENAQIIALSALMTTTMKEMEEVIKLAKERNVQAKIIIGGAVITQDYADEIGADGYSKDAAEAVKCASRLLNLTSE